MPDQPTRSSAEAGVRSAIENYFQGTYYADRARLDAAFHPTAVIEGYFEGQILVEARDAFISRLVAKGSAEPRGEPYDKRILSMVIEGKMAAVVAEVRVGERLFRDVISLLQDANAWSIRHKLYQQQ